MPLVRQMVPYYQDGGKILEQEIIMSKTNCINCGAAKDTDEIKCPFCGTTYLDFTTIDFSSQDPVVCTFKLPDNIRIGDSNKHAIMSMLARPYLEEISQTADTVDYYADWSMAPIARFTRGYDINIGVSFKPVAKKDGSILTLTAEQE